MTTAQNGAIEITRGSLSSPAAAIRAQRPLGWCRLRGETHRRPGVARNVAAEREGNFHSWDGVPLLSRFPSHGRAPIPHPLFPAIPIPRSSSRGVFPLALPLDGRFRSDSLRRLSWPKQIGTMSRLRPGESTSPTSSPSRDWGELSHRATSLLQWGNKTLNQRN